MGYVSYRGDTDTIPWAYRDRICTCPHNPRERVDHIEQQQRKHPKGFNARRVRCPKCSKYYDTVLNKCDFPGCGDLFLWTYESPNFCHHDYRCYKHLRTEPCEHPWCQYCFEGVPFDVIEEDGIPKPPPKLDLAAMQSAFDDLDLDF